MALFLTSVRIFGRQHLACGGNRSAEASDRAEVTQQINLVSEGCIPAHVIC